MTQPKYKYDENYDKWLRIEAHYEEHHGRVVVAKSLLESKGLKNLAFIGKKYLDELNIKTGKMVQIGGTSKSPNTGGYRTQPLQHSYYNNLEFYNLDLIDDGSPNTIVGDITNCPQVKDNTFDFVYSQDTFEHIAEPWKAAAEMVRILKPGGMCFVYTIFSWRYHQVPIDYWRFTPTCLAFLFKDLEPVEANWDSRNRRGPIQGKPDSGANDMVPEDHLGPWVENWRVYYVGKKT